MRTRNADTPKPAPAKKTPAKKTPIKTPPKPSSEASTDSPAATPKSAAPSTGAKQKGVAAAVAKQVVTPKAEPKVEEGSASVDAAAQVTPEVKASPVAAKKVVKRTPGKTTKPKAAAAVKASPKTPNPVEAVPKQAEQSPKEEPVVETTESPSTTVSSSVEAGKQKVVEQSPKNEAPVTEAAVKSAPAAKTTPQKTPKSKQAVKPGVKKVAKKVEPIAKKVEESVEKEEAVVANVGDSQNKEVPTVSKATELPKKEETVVPEVAESPKKDETAVPEVAESPMETESAVAKVAESPVKEVSNPVISKEEEGVKEQVEEEFKAADGAIVSEDKPVGTEEEPMEVEGAPLEEETQNMDEGMTDYGEQERFIEPGDEEFVEDDASEPDEGTAGAEVEQTELSAIANERKIKKELELFVGGLDRDATEDDVKKAFEKVGEVVEVRLLRNPSTNKNKGFAFVKFATKEQANKALSELKNPVIRGRRCGVARSEDNDTLFVGNICNTWTKEAIKQKMKEYGVEGVENITLVPDAQHEGLSRGFAFVEFSCHADATLAYKRLQKPDVVFGHAERTVKVGFAEPLRDPDPEIMAQVKSVFVDGLPPHWDEERVREHFKGFGEIERIVLARNMPTAKRKDFGFVDFTTHGAAVACIEGVNNTELGDGKLKSKVKVRFASPLPKTQAVKGGLCGGFRIGNAGNGTSSRFGRGFGRGGRPYDRVSYQHDRGFSARGRARTGRYGFAGPSDFESMNYGFPEQRSFGGRGVTGVRRDYGPYGEEFASSAASSSRPGMDWPSHGAAERGRGSSLHSRRQPFSPEGHYSRPYGVRNFVDDPHMYNDTGHGLKRPYSMMDHEPGYLEPSRLRPRYDYPDPAVSSSSGIRYQGSYGAGADIYSRPYSGPDYGGSSYSSMYGGDRSYGGGYYY